MKIANTDYLKPEVRNTTRRCRLCKKFTDNLKPYCIDHINFLPAGKEISSELKNRCNEAQLAFKGHWTKIDINSSRSQEILEYIKSKPVVNPAELHIFVKDTPDFLGKHNFCVKVIRSYLKKFASVKKVLLVTHKNKYRGTKKILVTWISNIG